MGGPIINPAFPPIGEAFFNTSEKVAYDGGDTPPGFGANNLLLEDGANLLLEDGCVLLLE
jgi:hypothetical protein